MDLASVRRVHVRVEGIVQGVGFRPFVHALATEYDLAGFVGNDTAGVFVEVEGDGERLAAFVADLSRRAPTLAEVERLTTEPVPPTGRPGFAIVSSVIGAGRDALISPDTATCPDCLAELADPADRRHGYPFTNCTNCGPRFTIVEDVPYDRRTTTMAGFPLCADCTAEYADPGNRRFHAEPVCCPACGPTLRFVTVDGAPVTPWTPPYGGCGTAGSSRSRASAATTLPREPTTIGSSRRCAPASTARRSRSP